MKIYRISQTVNNSYDTYDCAIVFAENEDEARQIHPSGRRMEKKDEKDDYGSWASLPSEVKVEYLGEARDDIEHFELCKNFKDDRRRHEVLCASFNAG